MHVNISVLCTLEQDGLTLMVVVTWLYSFVRVKVD